MKSYGSLALGVTLVAALLVTTSGCGSFLRACGAPTFTGYRFGACSMYRPEIRTVHVPIFESDSFRRQLGERLTEAVIKEIEVKTPYKVVSAEEADSVLTGRLTNDTKRIVALTPTDEPRDLEHRYRVEVTWTNLKSGEVYRTGEASPTSMLNVEQAAHQVSEVGQSVTGAQQRVIDALAQQIVALMEAPW